MGGLLLDKDLTQSQTSEDDNPILEFSEPFAEPDAGISSGISLPILLQASANSTHCHDNLSHALADKNRRSKLYVAAGAPHGLAEMLAKENIERRIFLLDNSGSTSCSDGHVVSCRNDGSYESVRATRWEEIHALAMDQGVWNAQIGVRSEFVLLNPPCPQNPKDGRDFAIIDPNLGNVNAQLRRLEAMLGSVSPRGLTPLAERLKELRGRLSREKLDGRQIMLSIVTDGLPTSGTNTSSTLRDKQDYMQELRQFAHTFNCFVVIRLCTDDDATVSYYNEVDEEMELPLDILDDLRGEADELRQHGNGWFAYTPLIHRIREGGTISKIFDLLDERPLTHVEIATFLEVLLRGSHDDPFPRDPKKLYAAASCAVAKAPLVYDGLRGQMVPPVNLKLLKKALGRTAWGRAKSVPAQMLNSLRALVSTRRARE